LFLLRSSLTPRTPTTPPTTTTATATTAAAATTTPTACAAAPTTLGTARVCGLIWQAEVIILVIIIGTFSSWCLDRTHTIVLKGHISSLPRSVYT
jgi:hypothetical protein